MVERLVNRLKQYRRIATRYEKRAANYQALLTVAGRTDREIAEILFIARTTASDHVSHILNKLGVATRAEAAAWAVRNGLA